MPSAWFARCTEPGDCLFGTAYPPPSAGMRLAHAQPAPDPVKEPLQHQTDQTPTSMNYLLQHSHACATLALPVFRIRVQALKHIEGAGCIQEMAHLQESEAPKMSNGNLPKKCSGTYFVAVIGNELEQVVWVLRARRIGVEGPCGLRLSIHDVAARQP